MLVTQYQFQTFGCISQLADEEYSCALHLSFFYRVTRYGFTAKHTYLDFTNKIAFRYLLEVVCTIVFTIEYVVRLSVHPI